LTFIFLFKSGLCGKRRFLWLGSKLTENLKDFKLKEGGAIMNLSLFSEVLFNRLKFLLVRHPEEIEENWIKHLPPEFNLMSLAELEKGCKISPLKLEELLDFDIQESNIRKITKARHAVITILRFYEVEIEWDGEEDPAEEEASEEKEKPKKTKVKSHSKKKSSGQGREMTPKMKKYAKIYHRAFPNPKNESLKEALARSFKENISYSEWIEKMKKALEEFPIPDFKINFYDFYAFKKHVSIQDLIISSSKSGL